MSRGFLNGATQYELCRIILREDIPGELKHLSSQRKSNQNEIPSVAASEQGRAQTGFLRISGVEDQHQGKSFQSKLLGRSGTDGETPVDERMMTGLVSRVPRDT